jgi:hypothetical protein
VSPSDALSRRSLNTGVLATDRVWLDSRVIAGYVVAGSLLLLSVQAILGLSSVQSLRSKYLGYTPVSQANGTSTSSTPTSLAEKIKAHVASHGGSVVFGYKVMRLISTSALSALIFATIVLKRTEPGEFWPQLALGLTAIYALILGFAYVLLPGPASRTMAPYATITVLSLFAVYAYRDVWPLLTFTLHPLDGAEGLLVWVKIALAAIAGVLLPMLEPYAYVPVNPAVRTRLFLARLTLCQLS